jgi:opacity protein-like surface antigen
MKRMFVAAAALTIAPGLVMAADMPIKAPAASVVSDWTGFYIGFHGGYGWGRAAIADADLNSPLPGTNEIVSLHAPKLRGPVFGGHAGYNWQWGARGIVGLEIDFSSASIRETQTDSLHDVIGPRQDPPHEPDTRTLKAKLDRLASARARVGFLVGPEFLLYGTAGLASGHTNFTDSFVVHFVNPNGSQGEITGSGRASPNQFGWAAGAGGEWKLWNSGLMLRVEYLHYDLGRTFLAFDGIRNDTVHLDKLTTNVVRGGLSYKF